MTKPIIQAKDLSKVYRLGNLGAKSFADDVRTLWNKFRGKEETLDTKVIKQLKQQDSIGRINPERKNEFWALHDINFEIQPGEVVGIIGDNGAGKSTLLKILSRITEPTTGEVILRGRVSSLLEVGTCFHPDLTGKENTYLNGAIHGMTKKEIDEKFDDIIEFANIQHFIDTPVKRYSSGMHVRLAFAVAAHLEPEILIVDEVLAVGDAEFQNSCLSKMKDISNRGKTVIFVSHIMTSVKALCNRCYLLEDGTITSEGATLDIIEKYLKRGQASEVANKLDHSKFEYDTGEARFISIDILDKKDQSKSRFLYRDPINIHIQFEVYEIIDRFLVSVHICAPDGTPIAYGCNIDTQGKSFSVKHGQYSLRIKTDEKLHPGTYFLKAALFYPTGRPICLIERTCEFTVEKFAEDNDHSYKWPRSQAYKMLNAEWKLDERKT